MCNFMLTLLSLVLGDLIQSVTEYIHSSTGESFVLLGNRECVKVQIMYCWCRWSESSFLFVTWTITFCLSPSHLPCPLSCCTASQSASSHHYLAHLGWNKQKALQLCFENGRLSLQFKNLMQLVVVWATADSISLVCVCLCVFVCVMCSLLEVGSSTAVIGGEC